MKKLVTDDQFRALLTALRRKGNLTQIDVAQALNRPQSFVSKYESGERRLDVVEFIGVCTALRVSPVKVIQELCGETVSGKPGIFQTWDITEAQLSKLVDENPSLRGIMLGYVAETKFHDMFLENPTITEKGKDADHNRKRKGDRRIIYKGMTVTIEVKSLQTAMVRNLGGGKWKGKSQVDGSDRRIVKFLDGTQLETTLLLRGEFDLLAVNCFAFGDEWKFAFAKNKDLPSSKFKKYTEEQRSQLIASLVDVTWPPEPPFTDDLFALLNELASEDKTTQTIIITNETIIEAQEVTLVEVINKS